MTANTPQPLRRRRNPAKLLARLNPKGIGLPTGAGRGSAASIESPLDVAAALGAIGWQGEGPRLAAMVLCLRWWPGLFEGPAKVIGYRDVSKRITRTQFTGRRDANGRAVRDQVITVRTERVAIEAPAPTPAMDRLLGLLVSRLRHSITRNASRKRGSRKPARHSERGEALPPALLERVTADRFMLTWARAVADEYRNPNQCPTCLGYGERLHLVDVEGKPKAMVSACDFCGGGGVIAWSGKRRAKALTIGEHAFREHLSPYHNGALILLRELEWRGARMLVHRLGFADPD